jgi:hypothetical protein
MEIIANSFSFAKLIKCVNHVEETLRASCETQNERVKKPGSGEEMLTSKAVPLK